MALARRTLLAQGLGLVASPALSASTGTGGMRSDVETFVSFGEHRTGTVVEARTADWFAGRLRELGYAAGLHRFPVGTVLDPGGILTAPGFSAPVFPQWIPPQNSLANAIEGPLALSGKDLSGHIAVRRERAAPGAYWPSSLQTEAQVAARSGARALVLAFDEPTDDVFACNQESQTDLPLAVGIIRPSDLKALEGLAARRSQGRLVLKGRTLQATGQAVLARKSGAGPAIVISTPLTGWFRCGAERGPGIALLLRLAKVLAAAPCPVVLLGTGAHELGHLGMQHLVGRAPSPDQTALWLHLGASLAAVALDQRYDRPRLQYATVSSNMAGRAGLALPADFWTRLPAGPQAPGETGDVIRAGHQTVIGLAGSFPGFHTPGDDGRAIDYEALEVLALALEGLVSAVSGSSA
jgi:hypothetical protein